MKSTLTLTTLTLALALTATPSLAIFTTLPASKPASDVLLPPTTGTHAAALPATLTGAAYTSLATALYSVQKKYENDARFGTVLRDVYSAAAKATNSEVVVPDLVMTGWDWARVTDAPWYDKNMPKGDREYVSQYLSEYNHVYQKFVSDGKDGSDGEKKSAAGKNGASLVAIAAVVAVMAL
ncbi:hypothetical protein PCL_07825 [Purpureocillium lilacinum]|uniref:Uncharacterized protein n=1 Tax=Purpureocillium lilacinum TaxID=33203 RepID=A0A2U3EJ28_PURLI|nr:hypothetical protein PCL_07825 [Purpureocillium lilacinum]